jgi:hypothetical protein
VRTGAVDRFALAANATSYTDTPAVLWTTYCYQLQAVDSGGRTLAASDQLCFRPRTRFGQDVPPNFAAKLNQSNTATLTWDAAAWPATRYVLLALPVGGDLPRISFLPTGTTSRTDATRGVPTCYILFSLRNGALSRTDTTCVVPGQATFDQPSPARVNLIQVDDVDEINNPPGT